MLEGSWTRFALFVSYSLLTGCGGIVARDSGSAGGAGGAASKDGGASNNRSGGSLRPLFRDVSLAVAPEVDALATNDVDLFDADNDGDLDILEVPAGDASGLARPRLRINESGSFVDRSAAAFPATFSGSFTDADQGDLDGDGWLDIVLAAHLPDGSLVGGENRVLMNAEGEFAPQDYRIPSASRQTVAVELCDFDSDGDLDIYFAHSEPPNPDHTLLRNDGGIFVDVSATALGGPGTVAVKKVLCVDLDAPSEPGAHCGSLALDTCRHCMDPRLSIEGLASQGRLDELEYGDCLEARRQVVPEFVLAASQGAKTSLLRQTAPGRYIDVSCNMELPLLDGTPVSKAQCSSGMVQGRQDTDVEAGDVDGDGIVDLVFVARLESRNTLLLNDGAGGFTDETATRWDESLNIAREVEVGDVDGDGDLDVVVLRGDPNLNSPGMNALFLNESGRLVEDLGSTLRDWVGTVSDGDLADYDADGDLDLVVARQGERLQILENLTR